MIAHNSRAEIRARICGVRVMIEGVKKLVGCKGWEGHFIFVFVLVSVLLSPRCQGIYRSFGIALLRVSTFPFSSCIALVIFHKKKPSLKKERVR